MNPPTPVLNEPPLGAGDTGSASAALLFLCALLFLAVVRRVGRGATLRSWVRPAELIAWVLIAFSILFLLGRALPETWQTWALVVLVVGIVGSIGLIRDVLAGMVLLLERRFHVGDSISVDGLSGEVLSWGLRAARLRATDGTLHDVPNTRLVSRTVTSLTGTGTDAVCEIHLTLPAGLDPSAALKKASSAAVLSVYASPRRRPEVFLHETTDGVFHLRIRGYAFDALHREHYESDVLSRLTELRPNPG